jgi:LDH2 family malate/lactate/ureidoglycolate dehydrogenase
VNEALRRARLSGPLWTASLVADRALRLNVLGRWPERRVPYETLERQTVAILEAWDVAEPRTVARHLLYADLHGIVSHGVAMFRHYAEAPFALAAAPEVVRDDGATALVDGGGGLGHLPADRAMRLAIEKAREHGVGAVAVRNSGHFGAAGTYAALARDAGLIGIAMTNTREPAVVPTHGAEPRLGTNAIAFAARELMLDMATSTVSLGRAVARWRAGRRIPEGWAIDARGRAVRSGRVAGEQRRLTPLGSRPETSSHKGYGLAAMVETLCGVMTGGGVGHFLLALDPERFAGGAGGASGPGAGGDFAEAMDAFTASLRATPRLDPNRAVLVPGDPERSAAQDRSARGIRLSRSVIEDLRLVAAGARVPFSL